MKNDAVRASEGMQTELHRVPDGMQEEAWFEQKVLEGLEGPVRPLTREDLDSVRNLVRRAHGSEAS